MRVTVFASGGGTNLQTLLDRCRPPEEVQVGLVVSDRASAGALERARSAGVETKIVEDPSDGAAIVDLLARAQTDLMVLAGYLKLVPLDVVRALDGRVINIHPALLPAFGGKGMYGTRVHQAVIESGATISGATVHLVDEEYDRGTIIAQWPVPVLADDTPDSLAARVLEVEHELLPAVVLAASRAGKVVRLPLSDVAFVAGVSPNVSTTLGQI